MDSEPDQSGRKSPQVNESAHKLALVNGSRMYNLRLLTSLFGQGLRLLFKSILYA